MEYTILIEDGMICHPWHDSHRHARNWVATVESNKAAPGGLARQFWDRRGEWYRVPTDLPEGGWLEFGADYYSGSNRRQPCRHYLHIVAVIPGRGITVVSCKLSEVGKVSVVPVNPLAGFSDEQLLVEVARRGLIARGRRRVQNRPQSIPQPIDDSTPVRRLNVQSPDQKRR